MKYRLESMKKFYLKNQTNKINWENISQVDNYAFDRIMSDLTESKITNYDNKSILSSGFKTNEGNNTTLNK